MSLEEEKFRKKGMERIRREKWEMDNKRARRRKGSKDRERTRKSNNINSLP